MRKDKETETAVYCSELQDSFSFDVGSWMFDVCFSLDVARSMLSVGCLFCKSSFKDRVLPFVQILKKQLAGISLLPSNH